jgi:hypothetical protein
MFNRTFWTETLERAVKTAAQSVILGLGLGEGFNAFAMDWTLAGGFAAGGLLLSLLTSVATIKIGESGSPSAVG